MSEPNDPVWWIDRLPQDAFADGFGLQTPLVNGQLKAVRYYSYFQPAVARLKALLVGGYYDAANNHRTLPTARRQRVDQAATLDEVYSAVGEDFYVVVPCPSRRREGLVSEGTRLTLVAHEPEGMGRDRDR